MNEALERARAAYGTGAYDDATIEFLFPEVKESEDERVRKELIVYLRGDWDDVTTDDTDRWIAYLEKQKEQKPEVKYVYPKFRVGDEIVEITPNGYCPPVIVKYIGEGSYTCESRDGKRFLSLPIKKENEYRLVDQKPVEWDEEDEAAHTRVIGALAKAFGGILPTKPLEEDIEWFKSLPKRFNLQPKQEWSEDYREEDIQTRFAFYTYKDDPSTLYLSNVFVEEASRNHGFGTRILKAAEKVAETIGATTVRLKVKQDSPANAWYRKNGYGYVAFEDGYDWLEKNLEYMKPNKQEWTEEDEKIRKILMGYCEENYACVEWMNGITYGELYEWLKSLRPQHHWKPSEEQITALNDAIDAVAEVGYFKIADILESLYEQLKETYMK